MLQKHETSLQNYLGGDERIMVHLEPKMEKYFQIACANTVILATKKEVGSRVLTRILVQKGGKLAYSSTYFTLLASQYFNLRHSGF